MITAVIGSGGKTTRIHELARMALEEGKKVCIITTTHMYIEKDTLITDNPDIILDCLLQKGICMAGRQAEDDSKITALSYDTYMKVCEMADEVLIEADGSRGLPLKYPGNNEPVIPDNVDKIIIIAGLNSLGQKASSCIHRFESAKDRLLLKPDIIVDASLVQSIIRKGYLERIEGQYMKAEITIETTQASNMYERAAGTLINANMDVNIIKKEWFNTKPELIICGAGHVAGKVARLGLFLDYGVTIIDDRPEFADKNNFPEECKVICHDFSNLNECISGIAEGYYIVVTRGHAADKTCVEQILNGSYEYLGMIGSHKKVKSTFDDLQKEGYSVKQIQSIHAPIGLPIHANTPEEIAVSIMAEIIEHRNSRSISTISKELYENRESGILCIITEKQGSSPRGIGSMMLVTPDKIIGTIGGGIMEKEVIETARSTNKIMEKEYNLSNDEAASLGMICGGINRVLYIPV